MLSYYLNIVKHESRSKSCPDSTGYYLSGDTSNGMNEPVITINLVVLNGRKYIRNFLNSVFGQSFPLCDIELNILDNGSSDGTLSEAGSMQLPVKGFHNVKMIASQQNLGMWGGQEELLKYSGGKYIVCAAVDVILDKDFIKIAVQEMEADQKIGALEAKIFKYDAKPDGTALKSDIIDTCGFEAFRSRRIVNIGHGQKDSPEFSIRKEIFAVEGAIPVFRKEALKDCEIKIINHKSQIINSEIVDHDFFWYADDLDLAWRMTLFGWKQIFVPSLIAWHDRQTTKKLRSGWSDFIKLRRTIPMKKRRLDWKNMHFTILKNDYTINILKDLPHILKRELMLFVYICVFEPTILLELPSFLRLMPKMLKKRRSIMRKARVPALEMRKFFR